MAAAVARQDDETAEMGFRPATRHTQPDAAALAGLADHLDEILANESPEQAQELLQLLVKEILVHDRRRISRPTGFRRRFVQCLLRWP